MERRSFLGLIAAAAACAIIARPSDAAAAVLETRSPTPPAVPDAPTTVGELQDALDGADGLPEEMQWRRRSFGRRVVVRRRFVRTRRVVWVRRPRRVVFVRRRRWAGPRVVRRCWWNGWTTVCRVVRVW